MSFDNAELKKEVDAVFKDADGFNPFTASKPGEKLSNDSEAYNQSNFRLNLMSANRSLPEENYDKVAEAVAQDERVTKYLPLIALDAMGVSPTNRAAKAIFSATKEEVDTNGAFGISKEELLKASEDTKHFDPVHQKALKYAAENFDKFRSFDKEDGILPFGDKNADNITASDLAKADQLLTHHPRIPIEISNNKIILDNFSAIDANGTNLITRNEGLIWLENYNRKSNESPDQFASIINYGGLEGPSNPILGVLPKLLDERNLETSEKKSRDDYKQNIADLTAEQKSTAAIFGW